MKNVVEIFRIPMSSLGGVHLISEIAQCHTFWSNQLQSSTILKYEIVFIIP